jgi:hypothetical protein
MKNKTPVEILCLVFNSIAYFYIIQLLYLDNSLYETTYKIIIVVCSQFFSLFILIILSHTTTHEILNRNKKMLKKIKRKLHLFHKKNKRNRKFKVFDYIKN